MLLEPVQGESGVYVLGDDVLRAARAACDAHGAALIFDEVQCGLGRTGTLWAYEHSGVVPDAMTIAKAPRRRAADRRAGHRRAPGRRLRARRPRLDVRRRPGAVRGAALAALDVIDDEALLARVRELGERLRHALRELPGVVEVRGRGLMLACELDPDDRPAPPTSSCARCSSSGSSSTPPGPTTVRLLPPLRHRRGGGRRRPRAACAPSLTDGTG